jgi:hypothetical protein
LDEQESLRRVTLALLLRVNAVAEPLARMPLKHSVRCGDLDALKWEGSKVHSCVGADNRVFDCEYPGTVENVAQPGGVVVRSCSSSAARCGIVVSRSTSMPRGYSPEVPLGLLFRGVMLPDPFGESPTPWWRRVWRRDRAGQAPKLYTVPAGAVGPIAGLLLSGWHGIDHTARFVVVGVLLVVPPLPVEMWWKRRRRRTEEQLLVFPGQLARTRAMR